MRRTARSPSIRIALHAINGVGLGHLVRLATIAVEMRKVDPGAQVLVLTNARDCRLLRACGLDYVQFPLRLDEPHADPDRATAGLPAELDAAAQCGALRAFAPDLVVFDTHAPWPLVQCARGLGARSVLVLRELKPEAWSRLFGRFAPWAFDRIVIPHEPGDIDVSVIPAGLPVSWSGPILRELDQGPVPRSLRSGGPLLVATAGGGGQPVDAQRFVGAVTGAHEILRRRFPKLRTIVVHGPNARAASAPLPRGLGTLSWTPALPALLQGADAVVSQAGYNAICELRALRKGAVIVPGARKMEDQSARAHRLEAIGAASVAAPTAASIAAHAARLLGSARVRERMAAAHDTMPLVAGNREAALALLRPILRPGGEVRRVVVIAHDYPPKVGGMETAAQSLVHALAGRGLEVIVYTAAGLGCASKLPDHPRGAPRPGAVFVRAMYVPLRGAKRIDLLGDLLLTLQALLADAPDAVHLAHAGLGPWIPAVRACLPCAITSHVHGNDLLAPWVQHAGEGIAYRAAIADGLNRADGVVAVSAFSRELAMAQGVRANRLRVLANGVDTACMAPGEPDPRLRKHLGIEPNDELLLTVSRLARRKGHLAMVAAMPAILARRPRALFAFTGHHDGLLREILEEAEKLGVAHRVRAIGWIPQAELPALYRLAKVFVLAPDSASDTDVEGFGIALLEAAACGVPSVASRSGGVPEAVADGETGLLAAPGEPRQLAEAVLRLLSDPSEARHMGEAGRERALGFSWDAAARSLLQQWNAALARPRKRLRTLPASFRRLMTGRASCGDPSVLASRKLLSRVKGAADLSWAAHKHAHALHEHNAHRLAQYRRWVERGTALRFRSSGEPGFRLAQALEDCRSLGHRPELEVKLGTFLSPSFQEHVRPRVRCVHLLQGIPCEHAPETIERELGGLHDVRSLRLYLKPEVAREPGAATAHAPQVHWLRTSFRASGVTVVPPPELMRYLSLTPSPGPDTAMIEPSNRCNLSCPTCPTGTGKIRPLPDMTREQFERVLDGLGAQVHGLSLWNYGEPALNPDLEHLVRCAKARGVASVKVSSNGLALVGQRARALVGSGLDVLILSVDGASQETYEKFRMRGSFEKVTRAVQDLCAEKKRAGVKKPSIELQFIVMRHNEHEIDAIRALARDWGVDRLRLKTFGASETSRQFVPERTSWSRYEQDGVTPRDRRRFCPLPWDHTVINVDGSVTPCCYLRPDMGEQLVMGNLFEIPFPEIWRGPRYQAFRLAMLERRASMPVCATCHGNVFDRNASVEAIS
jgi:glycosyltransferase involved in cell wall biosynthesis/MoaA/NifB/PqqE/SkfB family radical SAM enzyme/predicted glycosyltransferase